MHRISDQRCYGNDIATDALAPREKQGEDVGITVAQDFDFSTVYGLALK